MIFAQIKDGVVVNTIVLDDEGLSDLFSEGFDHFVRIDELDPVPKIGWVYDGVDFAESTVPRDAYNDLVTFRTDGVQDIYTSNGVEYRFAAGTAQAAAYLSITKQKNLAMFQVAVNSFIDARYSINLRFNFIALYTNAQANGLANRLAYVGQLFAWSNLVIAYCNTYITSINAMVDAATVAATTWDFSALADADPHVTAVAALLILD